MTLDPISLTPIQPQPEKEEVVPLKAELQQTDDWLLTEPPPAEVPHLGHAILFFVMIVPLLLAGEALSAFLAKQLHFFANKDYRELFIMMGTDARLAIPAQIITYTLVILAAIIIFPLLWRKSFAQGIQWNADVARSKFVLLLAFGLAIGFGISLLGNYLPMPKDPPIVRDMMGSPLGAWMMLLFGITCAPITEELAFRGFLLPGFIHTFRWLMQREILSPEALSWTTIPLSVVLTTIPFALLHSAQVSQAWAPLLLIGLVSIALCVVRLRFNSVAASAVVHAAYNFTLFAGLLLQTDGFRHLDKLNS